MTGAAVAMQPAFTHEQLFVINALWRVVKKRERERKRIAANPEKNRERVRKWTAANPDKKRECRRKRVAANPEKYREQARKWRATNPEKYREQVRKWQVANPDRVRKSHCKYRYGTGAHEHCEAQVKIQKNCCAICLKPFTETPHLDHNHETNQLRGALCRYCNTQLSTVENHDWMAKAATYLEKWGLINGNSEV